MHCLSFLFQLPALMHFDKSLYSFFFFFFDLMNIRGSSLVQCIDTGSCCRKVNKYIKIWIQQSMSIHLFQPLLNIEGLLSWGSITIPYSEVLHFTCDRIKACVHLFLLFCKKQSSLLKRIYFCPWGSYHPLCWKLLLRSIRLERVAVANMKILKKI